MVYQLLATGFEETEAVAPLDLLRRAGVEVQTVGVSGKTVTGSHNIPVTADILLSQVDMTDVDMVILPGGQPGVTNLRACPQAMDLVKFAYDNGKFVAAICAGPTALAQLGITDGKRATCYPGCEKEMGKAVMTQEAAVRDGRVITGTSAGCAVAFGLKLVEALKGTAEAQRIAQSIVIR